MSNQKLRFTKFFIPKSFDFLKSNQHLSRQINNFLSDGYLTYDDIKNYIKKFKTLTDSDEIEGYGGRRFYLWALMALNGKRKQVATHKKNLTDVGIENAYLKTHDKNNHFGRKKLKITEEQLNKLTNGQL